MHGDDGHDDAASAATAVENLTCLCDDVDGLAESSRDDAEFFSIPLVAAGGSPSNTNAILTGASASSSAQLVLATSIARQSAASCQQRRWRRASSWRSPG